VTEGRGCTFSENNNTKTRWKGANGHSSWKKIDMREKLKKDSSIKDVGVIKCKYFFLFMAFTFVKLANNAKLVR
jgi:hypothetical protein